MSVFRARFRCAEGCDFSAELTEVVYRCPRCRGLLEVEHDLAALAERPAAEWKALFDERFRKGPWPFGSGVWGKKEWIYPQLALENVVSMYEGGSPLLKLDRYAREIGLDDVWLKECGVTHTGSFKDLGMTVLVSAVQEMRARGVRVDAVACASTGDTSAALAAYCAAAGIPSVVLLPHGKISIAQLVQPISNGALVLELDTDFDGCMRVVQELSRAPGVYLANSMNSLRIEGQKTLSVELVQQLDWTAPDWIVIPGGNLGNASAVGRGFLMMRELGLVDRLPRLCVAQAENANPLYRAVAAAGRPSSARSARREDTGAPIWIADASVRCAATASTFTAAVGFTPAPLVARQSGFAFSACATTSRGSRSTSPSSFIRRKPFPTALAFPRFPPGMTIQSGDVQPSCCAISMDAVFWPSMRSEFIELAR